jgi:hypothetical protein
MDALFSDTPIFVANTPYAKVHDHRAAERELRKGTFVPGALTEAKVGSESPVELDGKQA